MNRMPLQRRALARMLLPLVLLPLSMSLIPPAGAGPLRDKLKERRAERQAALVEDDGGLAGEGRGAPATVPPGVNVVRDVAYGSGSAQRFDVYMPQAGARSAPVIFMVHGGGWKRGDKNMKSVVENKAARWVPQGFVFISVNYPMLPDANPLQQAHAVAQALAAAQLKASTWGGDPARFIVMGHSAGAHLVSLIASSPQIVAAERVQPWLGTIALDSAAYDVEEVMQHRHFKLYDEAFGTDQALWRDASPLAQLNAAGAPFLAVCSSRRRESCPQAHGYVRKATRLGTRAQVLEQDKSHKEINEDLGAPGAYTEAVEDFMRRLDPVVRGLLR